MGYLYIKTFSKGTQNWKKKKTYVHSLKSYKGLWNFRLLTFYLFLADRLSFPVHFLCVPKVVQLSEIDSEIENITWPRGDADLGTLTILPWVSRCFNFSHGLTRRLPISRFFGKHHSENSNEMLLRWIKTEVSRGKLVPVQPLLPCRTQLFTNWGGSNLFYSQPGEGHSFSGKEKITPCRFYFVYTSKATSQD